jgi:hypothetical protein
MRKRDDAYPRGKFRDTFVHIACWHCPRRGRYRAANLIAKYGSDMFGMRSPPATLNNRRLRRAFQPGRRAGVEVAQRDARS